VPAGADLDGRSLRPALDGTEPDGDPDRTVVAGTTIGWPMARRSRFKYFVHDQHGLPVLFDLDADPDERVNLAGDPALAAVEADLAAELAAALARPPFALTADA
jgi:choline-sulfatase